MKKLFPGRYQPTEEEFKYLFENAIISFDTNILLNLYSYSEDTRTEWFKIFDKFSSRLWLPYQVAIEYQENRLNRIFTEKNKYDKISTAITDLKNESLSKFDENWRLSPKSIAEWKAEIAGVLDKVKDTVQKQKSSHADLTYIDPIRDKIDAIFENKIGTPHTEEFLKVANAEGKKRFEELRPPGFKDDKKADNKFGDYFLWKELLENAKTKKKPLLLVTEDKKGDWWQIHKGLTIGPHPELVNEFFRETGQQFYMYGADQFLVFVNRFLKLTVNEEAVAETKAVRKSELDQLARMAVLEELSKLTTHGENTENSTGSFWDKIRIHQSENQSILEKAVEEASTKQSIFEFILEKERINKAIEKKTENQRQYERLRKFIEKIQKNDELSNSDNSALKDNDPVPSDDDE